MAMLNGAQSGASPVNGLLGSLLGGGQSSASPVGGLLGSLLGGGIQESDNSLNGNALLSALLGAMK
jgi:outer membrane lipoprotein SlyB